MPFLITEKSQIIISSIFLFGRIIFVWIFLTDTSVFVFSMDSFSVKFEYVYWNYWNLNPDFNNLFRPIGFHCISKAYLELSQTSKSYSKVLTKLVNASEKRCFCKKGVLKILENSQENT